MNHLIFSTQQEQLSAYQHLVHLLFVSKSLKLVRTNADFKAMKSFLAAKSVVSLPVAGSNSFSVA